MRTASLLVLIALVSFTLASQLRAEDAEGPKLVDEKLVLEEEGESPTGKWRAGFRGPYDMQLSPDGKKLLYIRSEEGKVKLPSGNFENRTIRRLVLRDLETQKDTVLPIPAVTNDDVFKYLLTSRLFDPTGERIVLGIGIDEDNDGVTSPTMPDKMQAAVYDIPTGKIRTSDLVAASVLPSFDRTGKRIFALTWDPKEDTLALYKADAEKLEFKPLKTAGLPRDVCPAADFVTMLIKPPEEKSMDYKLVLYDAEADRQVCEVPTKSHNWNLIESSPKWTANGQYLYYRDVVLGEADSPRHYTSVWDRKTGKPAGGEISSSVPIGPGPTATTMVLSPRKPGGEICGIVLHDAATGKSWELAEKEAHVVAAVGGKVLYVKWTDKGDALFSATIVMPDKAD